MVRITKALLTNLVKDPKKHLQGMSDDDVAQLVQHLNHLYYTKGSSTVPDNTFDIIKDHLKSINKNHPLLKHVGAVIDDGDKRKAKLPVFMGSMDKIKKDVAALDAFKKKFGPTYVISDKLDGVSGLFQVKDGGKTVCLYTRGDGTYGQNISHLIPLIPCFAQVSTSQDILVRGELIMSRANFEKVKEQGANARNMVAGLVNAKLPDLKLIKQVEFRAYALLNESMKQPVDKQFDTLMRLGFVVPFNKVIKGEELTSSNLSSILVERRSASAFEVDGIIVSDNAYHAVEPNQNPSYAFAFKDILTMETAEVMVTNVIWNVSKDGYFKPTVEVSPVRLNGVVIKKATGFNGDFIESNTIGPGAKIVITRSGDVIPYIVKVLTPADGGEAQMPTEPYIWNDTHKEIMVKGAHVDLDVKQIEHFFEKVDIKGVSSKSVQKLFAAGMKTVKDVVQASKTDFEAVPGLLNKSTFHEKLHAKLQTLDCLTLMHASNAFGRGFGERKLSLILNAFPKIASSKTFVPTVEDLCNVEGISTISASAFVTGLKNYREFIANAKLQCNTTPKISENNDVKEKGKGLTRFDGQTVVFTGFRNKEWEQLITSGGGKVGASVSSKTTILVVKDLDGASKKVQDAREKGVKILTMQEFEKLAKN